MWSAIESMHQKKIRRYAHVHENHDSNQEQGFYPISYYLFKKDLIASFLRTTEFLLEIWNVIKIDFREIFWECDEKRTNRQAGRQTKYLVNCVSK